MASDGRVHISLRLDPVDVEWLEKRAQTMTGKVKVKVTRSDIIRQLIAQDRLVKRSRKAKGS